MKLKEHKDFSSYNFAQKVYAVSMVIRELSEFNNISLEEIYNMNKSGYNHLIITKQKDYIVISRTFLIENIFKIKNTNLNKINTNELIYYMSDYLSKLSDVK